MTQSEPDQITPQKRGEPEASKTPPNPDAKKAKTEDTVQETPKKEATMELDKPKAEKPESSGPVPGGAPAASSPPLVELGERNSFKVGDV